MFLSKLSINKPILVTMGLLVFLVFGVLGYLGMSLDMVPTVDIPVVTIQTVYAGAGPEEIESQITKKIEDEISTISEIDYMQSYSIDNVSIIMVSFELTKDGDIAKQEVKDKVDQIVNDLPANSDDPIVEKFEVGADPVIELVLGGEASGKELYEYADLYLKDRFSQMPGVSKVNIIGGDERQIKVIFDSVLLKSNNLTMPQVSQILSANNIDLPSGSYTQGNQDYTVKVKGKFKSIKEIENLDFPTRFGHKKLGQLATVLDTIKTVRERAFYLNVKEDDLQTNVVKISLIKSSDGNTVDIANMIKEQLGEIQQELPDNMELKLTKDNSNFIKSSVNDTLSNIILGILFTAVILMFFLHDWRSTIIVALSMPFSIIATIGVAKMSGFTLNIMSLMGLSTSVGIIVTNSVVVIENIFKHKAKGLNNKEAADKGSSEIFVAVLASTLTNVVVFLPIATMNSIAGRFFREFALTVTYATVFSLITSFTLTPMLASLILPEKSKKGKLSLFIERMIKGMENFYAKTLHRIIDKKIVASSIIILIAALLIFSMNLFKQLGSQFAPVMDEGVISVKVELPQGYNLDSTERTVKEILQIVEKHEEVSHVTVDVGMQGDTDKGVNLAKLTVHLVDSEQRKLVTSDVAQKLIESSVNIPNAKLSITPVSSIGSGDEPIEFYIRGQQYAKLVEYNDILIKKMKNIPGITNVNSSHKVGKKEFVLTPRRNNIADLNSTVADIALSMRYAIEGVENTYYTENNEDYDLVVTMQDHEINNINKLGNIPLINSSGTTFTVDQVVDIEEQPALNTLIKRDKFKSIKITAGSAPGFTIGEIQKEINVMIDDLNLPSGYDVKYGGDAERMGDTAKEMGKALLLAILLTYMLLAASLESFTQPLLILVTLPLAVIGVALIMYFTGTALNIISMLSIVMLIGVVVNNAILIMEYYNQLRKQGKRIREALVEAATSKLRPILMSSIAIIFGMLPMAMGIGSAGKEMRQGMGLVTIGGIASSMLLTLYILPAMISLGAKKKHL